MPETAIDQEIGQRVLTLLHWGDKAALRSTAATAFRHARLFGTLDNPDQAAEHLLAVACYGMIGGCAVRPFLENGPWPAWAPGSDLDGWMRFTSAEAWLHLFRGQPGDPAAARRCVAALRTEQAERETSFLQNVRGRELARSVAWSLVTSHHLANAADLAGERLGAPATAADRSFVRLPGVQSIASQIESALGAATRTGDHCREDLPRLLASAVPALLHKA